MGGHGQCLRHVSLAQQGVQVAHGLSAAEPPDRTVAQRREGLCPLRGQPRRHAAFVSGDRGHSGPSRPQLIAQPIAAFPLNGPIGGVAPAHPQHPGAGLHPSGDERPQGLGVPLTIGQVGVHQTRFGHPQLTQHLGGCGACAPGRPARPCRVLGAVGKKMSGSARAHKKHRLPRRVRAPHLVQLRERGLIGDGDHFNQRPMHQRPT